MNEENKDALNNLINSIQEKMGNNESGTPTSTNSVAESNTPSFDISSLLNSFTTNNSNNTTDESSSQNGMGFDPSILLKIQKVMKAMNNNNPKKDLLLSLKPFLRKSRQDKMNEYITILNVISMLDSFKDKGSE